MSAGVRVPANAGMEGPVPRILTLVGQLERDTNLLVFELDEYLRLLNSMAETKGGLYDVANRAEAFGQVVGGHPLNIADKADALAAQIIELSGTVTPRIRALPATMDGLRHSVLELRYSVALMRLLTLMVGRFARSVLDGSEEDPTGSMIDLVEALERGFSQLGPVCGQVEAGVAALDAELGQVTPLLDRMVRRLGRWVDRRGVHSPASAQAAELAQRGTPEVRGMAGLAAECRGLHLPYDQNLINQRLTTLRQAVAGL